MVLPPNAVASTAIAVIAVGAIVVGALIYAAIAQYRRAQASIAAKRRLQAAADEEAEEQRRRDRAREAEISQIAFGNQRRRVREERPALVAVAGDLYAGAEQRWCDTSLLVPDRWLLQAPLPLGPDAGAVHVHATTEPGPRPASVFLSALLAERPHSAAGHRYERIADAIIDLEAPDAGRYVNRDCYRVVGLELTPGRLALELRRTSYFAVLDEAIPLECEIAEAAHVVETREVRPSEVGLPLRDALGDPFDVGGRTTVASVSALVLRRAADGTAEFWLHRRRAVGMVGGQVHVVPTGVFQPAIDDLADVFERDAAPWWTVVRESAEELLGVWNVDERAVAADAYEREPSLAGLESARRAGTARPWLVGVGLDPLSYWLELLTVLVIDDADFDRIVGQPPRENGEGTLVGRNRPDGTFGGLPFTDAGIQEALTRADLAPAADGLLRLAWKHRAMLV